MPMHPGDLLPRNMNYSRNRISAAYSPPPCNFYQQYGMPDLARRATLFLADNVVQSVPPPLTDWKVAAFSLVECATTYVLCTDGLLQPKEVLVRFAKGIGVSMFIYAVIAAC